MNKPLMIGDLGRQTGTKVNTIRFYEEAGLLPKAARTASGRRIYGADDVRRLAFIRRARSLGFGTDMIRSLLELDRQPERGCETARDIAVHHLAEVDARIRSLESLRAELDRMVAGCPGRRPIAKCQILEALASTVRRRDEPRPSSAAIRASAKS